MQAKQVLDKSILVADNDYIILEAFAGKLRQIGFKVITANSGDEVLNLYDEFYPDIIIIDENLKKINGIELFFRLFFRNPSIKIVLTTRNKQVIGNDELINSQNFVIKKRFTDDELKNIFKDVGFIPENLVRDLL